MDIETRLQALEYAMKMHQHTGADSASLRSQDFQQIGKIVLSAAASSMNITIPPKKSLKIYIQWGSKSGASKNYLRFNGNSGNVYTYINSGSVAVTSAAQIDLRNDSASALGGFAEIEVVNNLSTLVNSVTLRMTDRITSAATIQTFFQIFGTFVDTSNFITSVALVSSSAETFPSGSSILVLGSKE
jgi:hypothetical protein